MCRVAMSFLEFVASTVKENTTTNHTESVLRITYMSRMQESRVVTPADMVRFVQKNKTNHITGLLVRIDELGMYIQSLEGPPEQVTALLATIIADPRHQSVQLTDQTVGPRRYPQWEMKIVPTNRDKFDEIMTASICILAEGQS